MTAALDASGTPSEGQAVGCLGGLSSHLLPSGDMPSWAEAPTLPTVPSPFPLQSGRPSLKLLSEKILGIRVQQAEHCSVSVFLGDSPWVWGLSLTLKLKHASPDSRHRRRRAD